MESYNYQIPVPDAQPYDTVLAAMQASKMVLAGLDPKTGKKPVSADVSGNDAVDAAIAGGEAVSGNNAADAAADSKSTSGTTAVSGNDAAQDAEGRKLQMVRKRSGRASRRGRGCENLCSAKKRSPSWTLRPACRRRFAHGCRGFYRDMGKGAYFLYSEEIRARRFRRSTMPDMRSGFSGMQPTDTRRADC